MPGPACVLLLWRARQSDLHHQADIVPLSPSILPALLEITGVALVHKAEVILLWWIGQPGQRHLVPMDEDASNTNITSPNLQASNLSGPPQPTEEPTEGNTQSVPDTLGMLGARGASSCPPPQLAQRVSLACSASCQSFSPGGCWLRCNRQSCHAS